MIVLYKGSRGKGKTLSMVKDAFDFYKNGWKIYRNFYIKFGEKLSNVEILNLDQFSEIRNCVIVIDEVQSLFDSRNFRSKSSMDFSHFIQQIRKRNIIILATTQYANTVDKRFRQHIDVFAYPDFSKEFDWCKVTYLDISFLEDVDLQTLIHGSLNEDVIKKYSLVYDCSDVYNLYDTYEMVV